MGNSNFLERLRISRSVSGLFSDKLFLARRVSVNIQILLRLVTLTNQLHLEIIGDPDIGALQKNELVKFKQKSLANNLSKAA
tara:strand:+ start:4364 stop:4609 length:246 start_codon:yes stop_codon:yes gene_type:complete